MNSTYFLKFAHYILTGYNIFEREYRHFLNFEWLAK